MTNPHISESISIEHYHLYTMYTGQKTSQWTRNARFKTQRIKKERKYSEQLTCPIVNMARDRRAQDRDEILFACV